MLMNMIYNHYNRTDVKFLYKAIILTCPSVCTKLYHPQTTS